MRQDPKLTDDREQTQPTSLLAAKNVQLCLVKT
jgi:hypothetical protein